MLGLTSKKAFRLLFLFGFFTTVSAVAKNDSIPSKKSIKIFTNYRSKIERTRNDDWESINSRTHDYGKLSLVYAFSFNNNFHEIELSQLSFKLAGSGLVQKSISYSLGLSYGYHFKLLKNSSLKKLNWYVGLVASSTCQNEINKPFQNTYYTRYSTFSASGNLNTKLIYHLNKSILFELSIPVQIASLYIESIESRNPLIRPENQISTYIGTDFLASLYRVNLGIGVKL